MEQRKDIELFLHTTYEKCQTWSKQWFGKSIASIWQNLSIIIIIIPIVISKNLEKQLGKTPRSWNQGLVCLNTSIEIGYEHYACFTSLVLVISLIEK